jgi:hypothetical protein
MDLVMMGSSVAIESLSRFERSLFEPLFRIVLIVVGSAGVSGALWGIVRHVARSLGKGRPLDVALHAKRQFGGDIDKARSAARAAFPSGMLALGVSAALLLLGLANPYDAEFRDWLLIWMLSYSIFFGTWVWIEREFAWPGFLVARDVKGTPGMREMRRIRSRRDSP